MDNFRNDNQLTVSVDEAAALLGVSRPTVYQLIRTPGFPSFRVGSRRLISRAGLAEWIRGKVKDGGDEL